MKKNLLKYLKSMYGSHVGVSENQDLKMLHGHNNGFTFQLHFIKSSWYIQVMQGTQNSHSAPHERHNYFSFGKH